MRIFGIVDFWCILYLRGTYQAVNTEEKRGDWAGLALGGGKILDFRKILDAANGAYVVNGAYSGVNGMTGAPERDESVAVIREMLDGDIAAIRQGAAEASTSVSIVQRFTGAVGAVGDKLNAMARLAKKALDPDCTRLEAEQLQKEFSALSAEIEDVVQGAEYNYNKIFSGEGHTVSVPTGDGSWVDIFARDLSFDAAALDLAADAEAALSKVEEAIEALGEYGEGLRAQARRVEEATTRMESQAAAAMGVDLSGFGVGAALEVARGAASQVLADGGVLLDAQANVSPERGLQLLAVNN